MLHQEIRYLFLLSTYTEELITAPKTITFLLNPTLGEEKDLRVSNPIPYPEYLYLSIPAFLVNLTGKNKSFS